MSYPSEGFSFDVEVESHAPELYRYAATAKGVTGFASVGEAELERYRQEGFLVIHQAYPPAEVQAALDAITDLVAGKHGGFGGIQFTERVKETLSTLSLDEKLDAVRKLYSFTEVEPRLKAFAENPSLLDLVAKLIGAAPELYQSMALLKPPQGREKPWHQDHSHFDLPLSTRVVGIWIALDRATPENGCMRVLPGWHRRGPMAHEQRRDFQIPDQRMMELSGESLAVPMIPGDCLLFDSFLPHGTPVNRTSDRRWAIQFHFLPINTTRISHEERLAIFSP
jgi:ectoine hydroxylase-related dioxygenase (phytanoyl-CoA dioxygenase family)